MIGDPQTFVDFANARGVTVTLGDAAMYLVKVTDFLNGFNWQGEQANVLDDDVWPRTNFISNGKPIIEYGTPETVTVVPKGQLVDVAATPVDVRMAAYRLALASAEGIDISPISGGKETIRETVGPITMEYDPATIGNYTTFPWWDALLGYWIDTVSGNAAGNFDVYRG